MLKFKCPILKHDLSSQQNHYRMMRDFSIKFDTPTELCYDDFVSMIKFMNRTVFFDSRLSKLIFDSMVNARFVDASKLSKEIYSNPEELSKEEKAYHYLYLGCSSIKSNYWSDVFEKLSVVREVLDVWQTPLVTSITSPKHPTSKKSLGQLVFISDTYWSASKKVNEIAESYFSSANYSKVLDLYGALRKHDNGRLFYTKALASLLFLAYPEKVTNELISIGASYPIASKIFDLQRSAFDKWSLSSKPVLTIEEVQATNIKWHTLNWAFTSGMRYEGKTISEVLETDQDSIWWCIMNLIDFSVHPSVLLSDNVIKSELFYQALEVSLAKDEATSSWEIRFEEVSARWDADLYNAEAERERYNEQLMDDAIRDEERSMDEETDGFWRWNID